MDMITLEKRGQWRRTLFAAVLLGLLAGGALWWWQAKNADAAAGLEADAALSQAPRPPVRGDSALLVPPTVLPDGRPSDFSAEEWTSLKDAMAKTVNPQAEMTRVVAYLRFQKGFDQWQTLKDSPDAALRQQLAQRLMDQVPERVSQGEMTMGEALMLSTALLNDVESTDDARKQRLEQVQAILTAAAPKPDEQQQARDAALLTEYKRREAAIVADYQAKPEAQRNQAKLEEALESARRAVYSKN
jgi:hypothetical protein